MSLRALAFAALLWVSACGYPRMRCPNQGGEVWREYATEGLRIHTNLDAQDAAETAWAMQRLYQVLRAVHAGHPLPRAPVDVVVFRTRTQLRSFVDFRVGGFYHASPDRVLLVASGRQRYSFGGPEKFDIEAHELAHFFAHHAFPTLPRWVSEGWAEYLAGTRAVGQEEVELGHPPLTAIQHFGPFGRPLPLAQLWEWTAYDRSDRSGELARYASSWRWVHFLMRRHPDRFRRFQEGLARAEPPRRAFSNAFQGLDDAALEADLSRYLREDASAVTRIRVPGERAPVRERQLSDAEVHVLWARVGLAAPGPATAEARRAWARQHALAARAEDPHMLGGHLLYAELSDAPEERIELARRLAAESDAVEAWALLTRELTTAAPTAQRRQVLARAGTLGQHPRIAAALAVEALERGDGAGAQTWSKRALELAPWDPALRGLAGAAAAAAQDCEAARRLTAGALDMLHEGEEPALRDRLHEQLRRTEAGCGGETRR